MATTSKRGPQALAQVFKAGSRLLQNFERAVAHGYAKTGLTFAAPSTIGRCAGWALKLALAAVALFLAFWVAFIGLAIIAASLIFTHDGSNTLAPEEDHRSNPDYHPINFNDTWDPRFKNFNADD